MSIYHAGSGWTGSTWPSAPGTADTTTWAYQDATGLLSSKTDAAGKAVTYTYTQAGQIATRQWARILNGATHVTTTYTYSTTARELTGVTYNDGTPGLSYTYNRLGNTATVADVTGTRTFTYNLAGTLEMQSEDLPAFFGSGRRLTYYYDPTGPGPKGRLVNFGLGTAASAFADQYQDFSYLADGRLGYTGAYAAGYSGVGFRFTRRNRRGQAARCY